MTRQTLISQACYILSGANCLGNLYLVGFRFPEFHGIWETGPARSEVYLKQSAWRR